MIARVWRGSTAPDNAAPYVEHLRTATFPALRAIGGHRGAYALRRDEEASTEFLVVTLWDSVEAIRAFAGDDVELAAASASQPRRLRSSAPSCWLSSARR
ncbi:MAG: antibiotic biosynthesis monooxygenase [Actinomycetota bacterium]|nr:antibiotic biosynthesis monooxygenase [Actinomycetota bacterium]